MKSINKLHVIPFLMMLMTSNVSADSLTAGKSKAETCLGCHAIPGYNNVYPTYKVPKLAGQHAEYIYSQLKNFQASIRSNDSNKMMRNIVHRMTDEEMKAVSQYIQGLH